MRGSCRSGLKGHGTAGGMAPVFDSLGFPEIKELALAATFGILGAIIMGMALVNWAIRRGLVASHAPATLAERRAAERSPSRAILWGRSLYS